MARAAHMSATPIWTEAADGVAVRKTTGEAEKAQDCEISRKHFYRVCGARETRINACQRVARGVELAVCAV